MPGCRLDCEEITLAILLYPLLEVGSQPSPSSRFEMLGFGNKIQHTSWAWGTAHNPDRKWRQVLARLCSDTQDQDDQEGWRLVA